MPENHMAFVEPNVPGGRGLPQNDELAVAFLLKAVVRQAGRLGVAMVDGSNNIQVAVIAIYWYGIYWGVKKGQPKIDKGNHINHIDMAN